MASKARSGLGNRGKPKNMSGRGRSYRFVVPSSMRMRGTVVEDELQLRQPCCGGPEAPNLLPPLKGGVGLLPLPLQGLPV